jgi:hypothetical protein
MFMTAPTPILDHENPFCCGAMMQEQERVEVKEVSGERDKKGHVSRGLEEDEEFRLIVIHERL